MLSAHRQGTASSLPYPATPLIGRDHDISCVCDLFRQSQVRLVTLTGPGGVGKTRLAVAVAERLSDNFRDGIAFIELASLNNESHVMPVIANVLGVRERPNQSVLQGLQSALNDQERLLVLDNFEHLIDAAPEIASLLESCPNLSILITSRTSLYLRAEHIYPVRPLAAPSQESNDLMGLADNDAVAMFVERAGAIAPDFELTSDNIETIASICLKLDCLPLALELAASRIRLLRPDTLLSRLNQRLSVLTSGPRDLPERHRTLRGMVAWSCDLLTPDQQTVFRRLAVFSSPWTLDAAEMVVGGGGVDVSECIDTLLDHNLVVPAGEVHGVPTFSMLEIIREFATERFTVSEESHQIRSRHARWCMEFVEDWRTGYISLPAPLALAKYQDLRAALEWLNEHGDLETHLRLATGTTYQEAMSFIPIAERWRILNQALERSQGSDVRWRSGILCSAGTLANSQGEVDRARTLLDDAIITARPHGNSHELARALMHRGEIEQEQGNFWSALEYLNEALVVAGTLGDPLLAGNINVFMVLAVASKGDYSHAIDIGEKSYTMFRKSRGPANLIAHILNVLGIALLGAGDNERASTTFGESIRSDPHDRWVLAHSITGLSLVACRLGHAERSAMLTGFVTKLCEGLNAVLHMPERDLLCQAMDESREVLDDERFREAELAGRKMTPDQGVAWALDTVNTLQTQSESCAPEETKFPYGLTPRELEVLRFVAQGYRNREIAEALFISPKTADNHVGNILSKLDVPSRAAAARLAVEHGLIETTDT